MAEYPNLDTSVPDPRDVALRACVEAMAAARPVMWSPHLRDDVLRAELAAREVLDETTTP